MSFAFVGHAKRSLSTRWTPYRSNVHGAGIASRIEYYNQGYEDMELTQLLERWIIKGESEDARRKHLFGFLVPAASKDLAEYLGKRIQKREPPGGGQRPGTP